MASRKVDREQLGKRARQVLDLLYRRGSLTAAEVHALVPDLPSYSAARAVLRVLEHKGLVSHRRENLRYVYRPIVPASRAQRSAIRHLVETLFSGSAVQAMAALVDLSGRALDPADVEALRQMIDKAEASERKRVG